MVHTVFLALGLVLVVEGLVYALAPSLVESLLEAMKEMSLDARRKTGLIALALGVAAIWIAQVLG